MSGEPRDAERPRQGDSESPPPRAADDVSLYFETRHLKADLRRRSVRGGKITLTSQAAGLGLQVASTAILARLLEPEDFGLVAMASAITAFLLLLREMGLSTATVQRAQVNHAQISALFWINFGIGLMLAAVFALLARPIAAFYSRPELTNVVLVLALGVPLGALSIQHRALLQRQMRFGTLAAIDLGSRLSGIVAAVVLAFWGAGYWALVAVPITTVVVSMIGIWSSCRWRPGMPRRGSGVRSMLSFGGNVVGYNIVNYVSRNLDNILIGRFLGAAPLGLYSRAYSVLMLPLRQVNAPLAAVAIPTLARLVDEPERYRRAYCNVVEKIQMLSVPGVAFLIVCRDWVILLALGPKWQEAAGIFAMLGLAGLAQPLVNTSGWLFVSQGRAREMFRWGTLGGAISIASFVIGLSWGVLGVATAYTIGFLLRAPWLLWYVTRRGPVRQRDLYRTLKLPSLAACAVAISILTFRRLATVEAPLIGLAIAVILAAVASLAVYGTHSEGRRNLIELVHLVIRPRNADGAKVTRWA